MRGRRLGRQDDCRRLEKTLGSAQLEEKRGNEGMKEGRKAGRKAKL